MWSYSCEDCVVSLTSLITAQTVTNYLFVVVLSVAMIYTFVKTNQSDPGYINKPLIPQEEYKVIAVFIVR